MPGHSIPGRRHCWLLRCVPCMLARGARKHAAQRRHKPRTHVPHPPCMMVQMLCTSCTDWPWAHAQAPRDTPAEALVKRSSSKDWPLLRPPAVASHHCIMSAAPAAAGQQQQQLSCSPAHQTAHGSDHTTRKDLVGTAAYSTSLLTRDHPTTPGTAVQLCAAQLCSAPQHTSTDTPPIALLAVFILCQDSTIQKPPKWTMGYHSTTKIVRSSHKWQPLKPGHRSPQAPGLYLTHPPLPKAHVNTMCAGTLVVQKALHKLLCCTMLAYGAIFSYDTCRPIQSPSNLHPIRIVDIIQGLGVMLCGTAACNSTGTSPNSVTRLLF